MTLVLFFASILALGATMGYVEMTVGSCVPSATDVLYVHQSQSSWHQSVYYRRLCNSFADGAFVFRETVGGVSMLSETVVVIHLTAQCHVPNSNVRIWCTDTLLQLYRNVVSVGNAVRNGPFVMITLNEYERSMI
jgi:hypothetical protein